MTKQQDGNTSIKDLDELVPWSNTAKITNLDDTCQTADLSDNLFDDSHNNKMMQSCNSSFSDLAKEHSDKMTFLDFEADFNASHESLDWSENDAFPKSRSVSTSATPSTTGSTVDLSDFVVLSAFQVMEQEQQQQQQQQQEESEEEESEEEESEHESSEEEEEEEEEEESSDEEEEFPLVNFDESMANHFEYDVNSEQVVAPPRRGTRTEPFRQRRRRSISNRQLQQEQEEAVDHDGDSEQVLAPPQRDSIRTPRRRRRSTSVQNRLGQQQQQQEQEEAAAVALFCQQLASRGIDNNGGAKRQSRRGRQSLKQQIPSPLLHRTNSDSIDRSSRTENDLKAHRQRQQAARRSISRNRDNRPPTTRGGSHRGSFRDRSVSRDRSTASAPTALEITLDQPLLGKVGHGDSEEEEEDPFSNLFATPAAANNSNSNINQPQQQQQQQPKKYKAPLRRCRTTSRERTRPRTSSRTRLSTKLARAKSSRDALATDDHSRASSSMASKASKGSSKGTGAAVVSSSSNGKRERRRRSSHHEPTPATPRRSRRSVRATKSGSLSKRMVEGSSSKRTTMDASARSNPERSSLEDRLAGIDASARSNPETTTTIRRTRTTPEPFDVRPSKPRRKSSRATGAAARPAAVPSLSSFLN